jgi:hemoglobin
MKKLYVSLITFFICGSLLYAVDYKQTVEITPQTTIGKTLYERLGGYDAISALANDLLSRMQADTQLARFNQHRGEDGLNRSKQLLIDFLCSIAVGPLYYTGRDIKITHKRMKINESDKSVFLGHLNATLEALHVPQAERDEVVALVQSTKPDIVEA